MHSHMQQLHLATHVQLLPMPSHMQQLLIPTHLQLLPLAAHVQLLRLATHVQLVDHDFSCGRPVMGRCLGDGEVRHAVLPSTGAVPPGDKSLSQVGVVVPPRAEYAGFALLARVGAVGNGQSAAGGLLFTWTPAPHLTDTTSVSWGHE